MKTASSQYTRGAQLVQSSALTRPLGHRRASLLLALMLIAFALSSGCDRPSAPARLRSDTLTAFMHLVAERVKADNLNPAVASRIFAYVSVAQYEALVPALPDRRSLGNQLNGLPALPELVGDRQLDWPSAQAAAISRVARHLFEASPASVAALTAFSDATLAARKAAGADQDTQTRSVVFGSAVGEAIIRWADADGFRTIHELPYSGPVGAQYWQPTGDAVSGFKPAEPHWGNLRPFVMPGAEACAVSAPEPYSEEAESTFFAQAKAVYETSKRLNDDQRTIALAWADNPGQTSSPPGHWLELVGQLMANHSLAEASEIYALASVSMADAFIACWKAKYTYSLLRPETFIRRRIDANWDPLLRTPQFPEYPSGHSVVSSAAATVLDALLGAPAFEDRTVETLGYRARRFSSFADAAAEAAQSRIYAGIHYPMAAERGLAQGRCVGARVLSQALTRRAPLQIVPRQATALARAGVSTTASAASTFALSAADDACPGALDATRCMACCAEHHSEAASRVKDVTRDCICSTAKPTGCRAQCSDYCAGKSDDRTCYSCAFRQMKPEAACFRAALDRCTDASCVEYLGCRAVCAGTPLPR